MRLQRFITHTILRLCVQCLIDLTEERPTGGRFLPEAAGGHITVAVGGAIRADAYSVGHAVSVE